MQIAAHPRVCSSMRVRGTSPQHLLYQQENQVFAYIYGDFIFLNKILQWWCSFLVWLYLRPAFQKHEGYFETDLVILNRGLMPRTTPELAAPSPNFRTTPARDHLASTRPAYMAVLLWNWVSKLESFGPEVETLLPRHRGSWRHRANKKICFRLYYL
ncbi:hypothetical protein AVEN_42956-1 [Araneus ventricosus]|uniref:Uncharacterized protein n=1 Tax=Araneus ventricosus TaxID=182803 RepID=A0A4Y2AFA9_ARAVE|nr:hypothetical protein AVEN_42956-1 [Araneus ventricosus]